MRLRIYDIEWDDNDEELKELAMETVIDIPNEVIMDEKDVSEMIYDCSEGYCDDWIADWLSDHYGFHVKSFIYEIIYKTSK